MDRREKKRQVKLLNLENKKCSVNLCDYFGRIPNLLEENGLENFLDDLSVGEVDRIYIGSYYCSNYFLKQSDTKFKRIINTAKKNNYKITLVIPPLFPKDISEVEKKIKTLLEYGVAVIDEVTINDFGMLVVRDLFKGKKINLGRLLQKDNRDPRYEDYYNEIHTFRTFSEFYREFYKKNYIHGVEVDCTNKVIDIPNDVPELEIGVHVPFCYISLGSICEFASMDKEKRNRFVFADSCKMGCNKAHIECIINENLKFYRIGRSVLFQNEECEILGDTTNLRIIYSPIRELFGGTYENTCTFK